MFETESTYVDAINILDVLNVDAINILDVLNVDAINILDVLNKMRFDQNTNIRAGRGRTIKNWFLTNKLESQRTSKHESLTLLCAGKCA